MEERVEELERRVSYLERELDLSYERHQFKRLANSLPTDDDAVVVVSEGPYGYHARITNINGDEVQRIIERVERQDDIDFAVTETGNGVGIEVWDSEYRNT